MSLAFVFWNNFSLYRNFLVFIFDFFIKIKFTNILITANVATYVNSFVLTFEVVNLLSTDYGLLVISRSCCSFCSRICRSPEQPTIKNIEQSNAIHTPHTLKTLFLFIFMGNHPLQIISCIKYTLIFFVNPYNTVF